MEPSESAKKPGEVLAIVTDRLIVAVKGGILKIGKLRVDKGEKIGPTEFAQSVGLKVGELFGA
jgi:methionyl-tRNA formyltransferase